MDMKVAQSRITAQGQVSVPAEIRRRLGLTPGSVLEWASERNHITVRRAGKHSFQQLHQALFAKPPAAKTLAQLKEGIRQNVRGRHASH